MSIRIEGLAPFHRFYSGQSGEIVVTFSVGDPPPLPENVKRELPKPYEELVQAGLQPFAQWFADFLAVIENAPTVPGIQAFQLLQAHLEALDSELAQLGLDQPINFN